MSVEEGGSYSSRMSNKSEKNMADFDGEDSTCEEELVRLTAQQVQVPRHLMVLSPLSFIYLAGCIIYLFIDPKLIR